MKVYNTVHGCPHVKESHPDLFRGNFLGLFFRGQFFCPEYKVITVKKHSFYNDNSILAMKSAKKGWIEL